MQLMGQLHRRRIGDDVDINAAFRLIDLFHFREEIGKGQQTVDRPACSAISCS